MAGAMDDLPVEEEIAANDFELLVIKSDSKASFRDAEFGSARRHQTRILKRIFPAFLVSLTK